MSTVDDLLAQSLLLVQPPVPSDVVPYDDLALAGLAGALPLWEEQPSRADGGATENLTALCEAVVAHCTPEQLADFLTDQVPQPRAAWILGCVLHIAGADDGARFWWQYAAGADNAPASYCLYLQHLARGDTHAAALWRAQADAHTRHGEVPPADGPAYRMMTVDTSLATVLRILSRLTCTAPRSLTPVAKAVIAFVARAVAIGYDRHPDLEIPLPGPDFAEQIELIATAATGRGEPVRAPDAGGLPSRTPHPGAPGHGRVRDPGCDPKGFMVELVEVTDGKRTPVPPSGHEFFGNAATVCWRAATAANRADSHGPGAAYYLDRFRTRTALVLTSGPTRSQPGPRPAHRGRHL
ncbi:hypothetical protein AB0D49_37585 [Streptomyces sp. NPDC048290]|uniref:hypothetical protein n=1 Tax=Streptomyces sp. NPDC048290 TaxID=3155811 RepID=UPI00342934E0